MKEWGFAQVHPSDRLAHLHRFSMSKAHAKGEVESIITVHEFITPKDPELLFFAEADKDTNQRTARYRPTGWGRTLLDALSECVKAVHRFPYEGPETE
jgi:hypothetical protein